MIRALLPVSLLALAACAGPIDDPVEAGAPATTVLADGDSVRIAAAGPAALGFAEQVAAGCLLDGVLGGAAMIVDRSAGRITIVGDDDELVDITVVPGAGGSRLVLSGPAADDPELRRAMLRQIERAARTGETTCPALPA